MDIRQLAASLVTLLVCIDVTISMRIPSTHNAIIDEDKTIKKRDAHSSIHDFLGPRVNDLIGQVFNFGHRCSGHVIRLGDLVLNTDGLTFTRPQAAKLVRHLTFQSLEERMLVWAYECQIEWINGGNTTQVDLDVSSMATFVGDVMLNSGDMRNIYLQTVVDTGYRGAIVDPEDDLPGRHRREVNDLHYQHWPMPIRWTFYTNLPDFPPIPTDGQAAVRTAFATWETLAGVQFQEVPCCDVMKPYIVVFNSKIIWDDGCAVTNIGVSSSGTTWMGLGWCLSYTYIGILLHEIGHAIGLWHEQSRPDRDKYVTIHWDKMKSDAGTRYQFLRHPWSNVRTYGLPYDYGSVMHYAQLAGYRQPYTGPTITTHDPAYQNTIGEWVALSFFDVKGINMKYASGACPGHTSLDWAVCKRHGYRDPKNCTQCRCPDGLAPPTCELAASNPPACGANTHRAQYTPQGIIAPALEMTPEGPEGLYTYTTCYWYITSEAGIRLDFDQTWNLPCWTRPPCPDRVEIRFGAMGLVGPRYNPYNREMSGATYTYLSGATFTYPYTEVMVILHTQTTLGVSYSLNYTKVDCGGSNGLAHDIPCRRKVQSVVSTSRPVFCPDGAGGYLTCNRTRDEHEVATEDYCFHGYQLITTADGGAMCEATCGTTPYDPTTHLCNCGGRIVRTQVGHRLMACCNGRLYLTERYQCCQGRIVTPRRQRCRTSFTHS